MATQKCVQWLPIPWVEYSGKNLGLCFVSAVAACLRLHHGSLTWTLSSPFRLQDEKSRLNGTFIHCWVRLPIKSEDSPKGSSGPKEPQPAIEHLPFPAISLFLFLQGCLDCDFLSSQLRLFRNTIAFPNSSYFHPRKKMANRHVEIAQYLFFSFKTNPKAFWFSLKKI